jgi:hypothetical protein
MEEAMKRRVAFMYIIGDIDKEVISEQEFDNVVMMFVGVGSYEMATQSAIRLRDEYKVSAIELCAGFGIEGHAIVKKSVNDDVPIGAVRYDMYPGYGNISGDDKWING